MPVPSAVCPPTCQNWERGPLPWQQAWALEGVWPGLQESQPESHGKSLTWTCCLVQSTWHGESRIDGLCPGFSELWLGLVKAFRVSLGWQLGSPSCARYISLPSHLVSPAALVDMWLGKLEGLWVRMGIGSATRARWQGRAVALFGVGVRTAWHWCIFFVSREQSERAEKHLA